MMMMMVAIRDDKRGGATPGGAWLSHAVASRLPAVTVRNHARVLAQGGDGTADVRDTPVETGRVFHADWERIHGLGGASQINAHSPVEIYLRWIRKLSSWPQLVNKVENNSQAL